MNRKAASINEKRGVALMMTLVVIGLMSAAVVSFVRLVNIDAKLAENIHSYTQAEILARAGVKGAMTMLAMDDDDVDAPDDMWADFMTYSAMSTSFFEEGHFTGQIVDLASRLSVNEIINPSNKDTKTYYYDVLYRLLNLYTEGQAESLIQPLQDWLDNDDSTVGIEGAEDSYYLSLEKPYLCANGSVYSFGQLSLIKNMTSELLYGTKEKGGLQQYLTVYPLTCKTNAPRTININTAGKLLLMSLHEDMTESIAQEIIDYRTEHAFEKIDELVNIPSITSLMRSRIHNLVDVKSSYFLITVDGFFRDSKVGVTAVVKRINGNVKLIYYKVG